MTRAGFLGLGSNVGDRRANLQAAVNALPAHGVGVLAASSTYDTEPVGEVLEQPDFLNACIRIETDLEPEALLDACKAVEAERGRVAGGVRHGPWRTPPSRSRPRSRSTALHASSSASGSSSVAIRTHAFRNAGWSSTRPTGSVS